MSDPITDPRRALPSVSSLLESEEMADILARSPRQTVTMAVREVIDSVRAGRRAAPESSRDWAEAVEHHLVTEMAPTLRPAINATGIVLHTNLGRAPLAAAAIEAIRSAAAGYSTLEYDLETGERGSRHTHCANALRRLTAAEDALVVNNCAGALVLALNTLAERRAALVSRGELVEIGGSFRIPAIMERSGARLVEVGTTNRTHALDYRAAITGETAAIVKVHRSNFSVSGFTTEATVAELSQLAADHSLPLIFDLGSGLLFPLEPYGFPPEPTAGQAIADGATLVLMSGDKLMGGPQAGVIVGKREVIARLRANPLARALRVDKLTLAALGATLDLHRSPETAVREIPALAMLCAPVDGVRARADAIASRARAAGYQVAVVESAAAVGAGAFPVHQIPSAAIAIDGDVAALERALRAGDPPVIGRIHSGRLLLDLRSIPPHDDEVFAAALLGALAA